MRKIQNANFRYGSVGESYIHSTFNYVLPDRVPSLAKIVQMLSSGRPVDNNLIRNLDFNELEDNPVFRKGFDLVDFYQEAKRNQLTFEEAEQELQNAKLAKENATTLATQTQDAPPPVE